MLDARAQRRFWAKVQVQGPDECWPWIGARHPQGYGNFGVGSRKTKRQTLKAHRVAYELVRGPIPDGLLLRHTCDNPPCCNPWHGIPGNDLQNVQDMADRGRRAIISLPGELNGRAKLSNFQARAIRSSHERAGILAQRFGVSRRTIWRLRSTA